MEGLPLNLWPLRRVNIVLPCLRWTVETVTGRSHNVRSAMEVILLFLPRRGSRLPETRSRLHGFLIKLPPGRKGWSPPTGGVGGCKVQVGGRSALCHYLLN